MSFNIWLTRSLGLIALAVLAGCGADPLASKTAQRLKGIAEIYLSYAAAKSGGGPESEAVFKKYMKSVDAIQLEMAKIDPKAIDDVFVSERDKQPFVIVYGLSITRISGDSKEVLAYEKTGENGKHLLSYINGKVDHVSADQLQSLLAAKEKGT
jgi:hypothetical protein